MYKNPFEFIKPGSTVLVIGADYIPIHFSSWKRAVLLLVKEKAEAIAEGVIRLLNYVKIPFLRPEIPTRKLLFKRDDFRCAYCGKRFAPEKLTVDHVIPSSRGGTNDWNNVLTCCSPCNLRKGNKTPKEAGMKPLRQPSTPFNKIAVELAHANNPTWREYSFTCP
jgi:5-methylcytosine-specific restriction endonuclease McrA